MGSFFALLTFYCFFGISKAQIGEKQINSNLTLKYDFDAESGYVHFTLESDNSGWFGVGFGNDMSPAYLMVVEIDNGALTIKDYYSTSTSRPNLSSTQEVQLIEQTITGSLKSIKFKRALDITNA